MSLKEVSLRSFPRSGQPWAENVSLSIVPSAAIILKSFHARIPFDEQCVQYSIVRDGVRDPENECLTVVYIVLRRWAIMEGSSDVSFVAKNEWKQ